MGLFHVGCRIVNPVNSKSAAVRRLMVDTGAESTWIDATVLEAIGIERRKKDLQFQLANGQIVTRSVGYAVLKVDKSETVDEVVFAERGDLQLLGARALEGLNLQVDSRGNRLVAAGPIVTALRFLHDSDSWCRSREKAQGPHESAGEEAESDHDQDGTRLCEMGLEIWLR
jgi:predicted aspartyl protease